MKPTQEILDAIRRAEAEGRVTWQQQTSPPAKVSEKDFSQAVYDLAKRNGWRVFRVFDSRRCPAGFPDLTMLRGPRLVIVELKVGDNKPTAAQEEWLEAYRDVGAEVYIWFPESWEEIERVLR